MDIELRGGAFKALPFKNPFRGPLAWFFGIGRLGDKNNIGRFFWNRFLAKKMPYEKVLKTTQNVPKTVDNY